MLRELLLPTTDRLVVFEALAVIVGGGLALVLLRQRREWQQVATGVVLLLLGWFALRAVH